MPDAFLHIVLTKFRKEIPDARRQDMQRRLAALGDVCGGREAGILVWRGTWNLDQRKSYHLMELGLFADEAAFLRYRGHPAHAEFAAEMSQIADWVVGNMALDPDILV